MKELNSSEVSEVSGAFLGTLLSPVGAFVGGAVGVMTDLTLASMKIKSNFTSGFALAGAGIVGAMGLSPITATLGIASGVNLIVSNGYQVIKQVTKVDGVR